eukprot:TRINITY_DN1383_c4_g1_i1.p1 TRINITY_DN1383_c4_g1~~TRINITY_DN1383_c4_g1_i1.p1  ORF type:complete len:334 (+),score=72.50 TRINITY_DN1383_c4_g1_i1:366-1367(+)
MEKKTIYNVFIFSGQSNCCGKGKESEIPDDITLDKLKNIYFNFQNDIHFSDEAKSDSWTHLQLQKNPMLEYKEHFGPEYSFATLLQDYYNAKQEISESNVKNRVCIIKYAIGSTNLHTDWNPNNEDGYYNGFITFVRNAMSDLEQIISEENNGDSDSFEIETFGLIWYQGEGDSNNATNSKGYKDNLKKFIRCTRNDLNISNVIVTEIQWATAKKEDELNKSIKSVVDDDDNVEFVTAKKLPIIGGKDQHLNGKGSIVIGERYFNCFIQKFLNDNIYVPDNSYLNNRNYYVPVEVLKKCTNCLIDLPKDSYSSKQWKKSKGRCLSCISNNNNN